MPNHTMLEYPASCLSVSFKLLPGLHRYGTLVIFRQKCLHEHELQLVLTLVYSCKLHIYKHKHENKGLENKFSLYESSPEYNELQLSVNNV